MMLMDPTADTFENRLRCRRTLHTTFIIFLVLFLLDNQPPPPSDRHKELKEPVEEPPPSIEGAELLNTYYNSQPAPDFVYARNTSGVYRGRWKRVEEPEDGSKEKQIAQDKDALDFSRTSGRAHLQLQMNSIPGVGDMSTVSGALRLRDGMITTVQDVTIAVQGFVFHLTGKVLLKAVEQLEDEVFVYLRPENGAHFNKSNGININEMEAIQSSFASEEAFLETQGDSLERKLLARLPTEQDVAESSSVVSVATHGMDGLIQTVDGLPVIETRGAPHEVLAELTKHALHKLRRVFNWRRTPPNDFTIEEGRSLRGRMMQIKSTSALDVQARRELEASGVEEVGGKLKIPIPTGVKGFPIDTNKAGVPCNLVVSGDIRPFHEKKPDDTKTMEKTAASSLLLTATSEPCGLQFNMTLTALRVDWKKASAKATNYSVTMTLAAVLQIAALLKQLQHTNTQAAAARMSLVCIAMQALIDALLCILHLLLCVVIQSLFAAFASIAFFKLIIFCIFEMRYMVLIFQARQDQDFFTGGWAEIRRRLASLHAYFYGVLMALIVFMYLLNVFTPSAVPFVLLLGHSFWIPQIIENVRRESRTPLCRSYLLTMSTTRLLIPLYLYGCPANILNVFESNDSEADGEDDPVSATNVAFCVALVLWVGAQTAVLLLQEKLGPQFFVPAMFLPEKYNYRRPIPPENEGNACVICICELGGLDNVMVAPCGHAFHSDCLLRWMEERAECPVCRGPLPAP